LYWFFQAGRTGPFGGYQQTLDEAFSALEKAWLSGWPDELHGLTRDQLGLSATPEAQRQGSPTVVSARS
jgi:hypothetical protein